MKNYSRSKAHRGRAAYRTPSVFRYKKSLQIRQRKSKLKA